MVTAKSSFPNQAAAFLGGLGDEYYHRNKADFGKHDLVMDVLEAHYRRVPGTAAGSVRGDGNVSHDQG